MKSPQSLTPLQLVFIVTCLLVQLSPSSGQFGLFSNLAEGLTDFTTGVTEAVTGTVTSVTEGVVQTINSVANSVVTEALEEVVTVGLRGYDPIGIDFDVERTYVGSFLLQACITEEDPNNNNSNNRKKTKVSFDGTYKSLEGLSQLDFRDFKADVVERSGDDLFSKMYFHGGYDKLVLHFDGTAYTKNCPGASDSASRGGSSSSSSSPFEAVLLITGLYVSTQFDFNARVDGSRLAVDDVTFTSSHIVYDTIQIESLTHSASTSTSSVVFSNRAVTKQLWQKLEQSLTDHVTELLTTYDTPAAITSELQDLLPVEVDLPFPLPF